MRVPHTIDRNTLLAYGPSDEAREASSEVGRTIRAEDQLWDEGHVPTLVHLCCNQLPAVLLSVLPCHAREYMLETLPTDLPLDLATKVIQVISSFTSLHVGWPDIQSSGSSAEWKKIWLGPKWNYGVLTTGLLKIHPHGVTNNKTT